MSIKQKVKFWWRALPAWAQGWILTLSLLWAFVLGSIFQ